MQSVDLSNYVPECKITIVNDNGKLEPRDFLSSVQIDEKIGNVAEFNLVLADPFDIKSQKFTMLNGSLFRPETKVGVSIGYVKKLEKMIDGKINSISTSGFTSDIPKLTIVGYDISHNLLTQDSIGNGSIKIEKNDTYSDIADKIADTSGLKGKEVDTTKLYSPIIIKKPISCIEFLKDVTKRVGFEFFVARNSLFFINPRILKQRVGNDTMKFKWGTNLVKFTPSLNISDIIPGVIIRGHLPDSKKQIIKEANSQDEDTWEEKNTKASELAIKLHKKKKEITDKVFSTEEEASDMAKAELNMANDNLITGSGTVIGAPTLSPGQFIELDDLSEWFSGKYFVTGVSHTFDSNGFITNFSVRKNTIGGEIM